MQLGPDAGGTGSRARSKGLWWSLRRHPHLALTKPHSHGSLPNHTLDSGLWESTFDWVAVEARPGQAKVHAADTRPAFKKPTGQHDPSNSSETNPEQLSSVRPTPGMERHRR
jgi:hypothetical protein